MKAWLLLLNSLKSPSVLVNIKQNANKDVKFWKATSLAFALKDFICTTAAV